MSEINFGLVDNGPDPATTIMQLYEAGRQQARQQQAQKAMTAYAIDPNINNLLAVAPYDSKFVIDERRTQAKLGQEQGKRVNDYIANLARNATTPEAWAAGVQVAKQRGIQVPPEFEQFSQQNRAALMALGGENQPNPTALQQNREYLESLGQGYGDRYIQNYIDPVVPVTEYDANGTGFTSYRPRSSLPRGPVGAPAGRPAVGSVIRDPRTQGGAAPSGPRTFR